MANSTPQKPHLVFVPGSFCTPAVYSVFADTVQYLGYTIDVILLRTIGRRSQPATMYDDAQYIASVIQQHVNVGKEVVVITHSYGGVPGTQSLNGLTGNERSKNGEKGGVSRIIYTSSVVPSLDVSVSEALAANGSAGDGPSPFKVHEDGYMTMDLSMAGESTFNLLPTLERKEQARSFVSHSAISFTNKLTHAGYLDVPVTYILCTEDLLLTLEFQHKQIQNIRDAGGKVDVVEVGSDHGWAASVPRLMARRVLEAVSGGEVVGEGIREQV